MHKSASFDAPLILAFLLHGAYHVCDDCFIDVSFSGRPCVYKGNDVCLFRSSEDSAVAVNTLLGLVLDLFALTTSHHSRLPASPLFSLSFPVPLTAGLGPQWSSMWPFLIFLQTFKSFRWTLAECLEADWRMGGLVMCLGLGLARHFCLLLDRLLSTDKQETVDLYWHTFQRCGSEQVPFLHEHLVPSWGSLLHKLRWRVEVALVFGE